MAWYQRSYLNNFLMVVNFILFRFIFLYLFFIIFNFDCVNCVNFKIIKEISDYSLKEICHKNINIKCSNIISDNEAKLALEYFIENKNLMNNFNICKYYINNSGILLPFDKNSCYSHPNFYFGSFENVYFNYQFTHNNKNSMFNKFLGEDLFGYKTPQFVSKYMYLYHNSLSNLYLNNNSLNFNNHHWDLNEFLIKEETKKSIKIQKYIDENFERLKNLKNQI